MTIMRSAQLLLIAGSLGSFCSIQARSYLESSGCLFALAQPTAAHATPRNDIRFSFLPMATAFPPLAGENFAPPSQDPGTVQAEATVELPARVPLLGSLDSKNTDPTDDWPIFHAFRHWQTPGISGLSRPFRNPGSVFALDYSDIFETGRAAYKGGHGISLFFRHQF